MRSIVLFARAPEREAAAKGIPAAAPLFRAVVAAWLEAAVRHNAFPLIACAPEDREALGKIAPSIERGWIAQSQASFGIRVADAVDEGFARGFTSVLVAAIDAPPPHDLARAFESLDRDVAVVGPARDGGVNFIGITRPERALLENLTTRRCREYFHELLVMHAVTDVDSASSLAVARNEKAWREFFTPRKSLSDRFFRVVDAPARLDAARPPPSRATRLPLDTNEWRREHAQLLHVRGSRALR